MEQSIFGLKKFENKFKNKYLVLVDKNLKIKNKKI